MRVIGGTARGARLQAPPAAVRPTSDLVRGAVFDMLDNLADDWDRVLDLYAGSGALGIEALSRGAGWADLVEQDARVCRVIRANLALTHLAERAQVHTLAVRRALAHLPGPYGLVFIDPPYQDAAAYQVVRDLAPAGLVSLRSTIVVEHSSRIPLEHPGEPLGLVQERRYGDTAVSLFRMQEGASVGHRGVSGNL